METLPSFGISRADMLKRGARFKDLKGSDGGLPDSKAPQCERTLYNVIGFQPPKDSGGAVTSPVGDDASRLSAIPISVENHRVQVFDGNGKYETQWNNLHRPCGLF